MLQTKTTEAATSSSEGTLGTAGACAVDLHDWREKSHWPGSERLASCAVDGDPRNSQTGAEIPNEGEGAKIDWLSFTLPPGPEGVEVTAFELAYGLAGKTEVPALERGNYGYSQGLRLPGNGLVFYSPDRPDMGVHCSLSSGALGLVGQSPRGLIGKVLELGGRFTRVDVALDSHTIEFSTVKEACERGDIVTRAEEITYGNTQKRVDGKWVYGGAIVRIGSRSSRKYVRCYDKAAEQKLTDGSIWTRLEVEFKAEFAQMVAVHIHNGSELRSAVCSALDFRDRSADSKVTRCPQLAWWAEWIGDVERLSFAVEAVTKTIRRSYEWLVRQCAPTLAFLDEAFGKNPRWLFNICDENRDRVPVARLKEIAAMPAALRLQLAGLAPR